MFAQVGAMASGAKFEGKVRLQNSWLLRSSLVLLEEGVCYDQCIFLAKLYHVHA